MHELFFHTVYYRQLWKGVLLNPETNDFLILDEGFIEVSFDPKKLEPDELFPADIFTTSSSQHKSLTPTPSPVKQLLIEPEPPTAPEHLVDSVHTESSEPEHIEITEPEPTKTTSEAPRDLVKQFTQLVEVLR